MTIMTQNDIIAGLQKDRADLAQCEQDLITLANGGCVENLTIDGCEKSIRGLRRCIANKELMVQPASTHFDQWHAQADQQADDDHFERLLAAFPGSSYISHHGFASAWRMATAHVYPRSAT